MNLKATPAAPVIRAVRTISETDEIRTIEGLGIPFGGALRGRDSYGTFASARTDFHWDLFPDMVPLAARSGEPSFIRPVTYNHGFDAEIGLSRIGGWSPVRADADGIWVEAQLDKRARWYARIAPLLDADVPAGRGGLGFSIGSAEHAVRFDERTGEWLEWPAYELALTPTEANPYAVIAARTTAAGLVLAGDSVTRETNPPAAGRGPNSLRYSSAAWDASAAAWTLASLIDLLGEEAAETEQAGYIRDAIAALQKFIDAEQAEIGSPADNAESAADMTFVEETISVTAWASGVRARQQTSPPSGSAGNAPATAPAADAQPALRIVAAVRSDADPMRELKAIAERAGTEAAARLTGPPRQ